MLTYKTLKYYMVLLILFGMNASYATSMFTVDTMTWIINLLYTKDVNKDVNKIELSYHGNFLYGLNLEYTYFFNNIAKPNTFLTSNGWYFSVGSYGFGPYQVIDTPKLKVDRFVQISPYGELGYQYHAWFPFVRLSWDLQYDHVERNYLQKKYSSSSSSSISLGTYYYFSDHIRLGFQMVTDSNNNYYLPIVFNINYFLSFGYSFY